MADAGLGDALLCLWCRRTGALLGITICNLCVFLAFLLAARRLIEWTGGAVQFGQSPLRDQLRLGQQILNRVLVLLIGMAALVALLGFKSLAPNFLMGFDGIAFDQFTMPGMVWSAFLAGMVFLMLVDAEANGKPSLPRSVHALVQHWRWVLPAILLVALMQIVLSFVQGQARYLVWLTWQDRSHAGEEFRLFRLCIRICDDPAVGDACHSHLRVA